MILYVQHWCLIALLLVVIVVHSGRFLWFTCIGESDRAYTEFAMVAIETAYQNAPSLIPVLIMSGQSSKIPLWMHHMHDNCDLIVVNHNLSFASQVLQFHPEQVKQLGAFLRLDISLIIDSIADYIPSKCSYRWNKDYTIYTDTDVMFMKDINLLDYQPSLLSMGPQLLKGTIANTGVLIINIAKWKEVIPHLLQYANLHKWNFHEQDQGLILSYIRDHLQKRVSLLPNELNWKPYWTLNNNASIIHFHGPKPKRYGDCFALMTPSHHHRMLTSENTSIADRNSKHSKSTECIEADVDRIYREKCNYPPYYIIITASREKYKASLCQQALSFNTYLLYYYSALDSFLKKIQAIVV